MLIDIYRRLLAAYGPQGWWPVSGRFRPRELEIIIGAVLTQNTNWGNVEKALRTMEKAGLVTTEAILAAEQKELEEAIRPSGFYRQKAVRLAGLLEEIGERGGVEEFLKRVKREELLELRGIGPETADSLLLYAAGRAEFVVDAYTRRILGRLGLVEENQTYGQVKQFFEAGRPRDAGPYNEFHALLVRLAKERCRKKPVCGNCPLQDICGVCCGTVCTAAARPLGKFK